jgi:hypothetical protein
MNALFNIFKDFRRLGTDVTAPLSHGGTLPLDRKAALET